MFSWIWGLLFGIKHCCQQWQWFAVMMGFYYNFFYVIIFLLQPYLETIYLHQTNIKLQHPGDPWAFPLTNLNTYTEGWKLVNGPKADYNAQQECIREKIRSACFFFKRFIPEEKICCCPCKPLGIILPHLQPFSKTLPASAHKYRDANSMT